MASDTGTPTSRTVSVSTSTSTTRTSADSMAVRIASAISSTDACVPSLAWAGARHSATAAAAMIALMGFFRVMGSLPLVEAWVAVDQAQWFKARGDAASVGVSRPPVLCGAV